MLIGTVNQAPVGDLSALTTSDKSSAVAAINELVALFRSVEPPPLFSWSLPFTVIRNATSFAVYGFDVSDKRPDLALASPKAYYVDVATGADANPGTSGSPLKSIYVACNKPDVDIIYVKPGTYHRSNGFSGMTSTRSFSVLPWGGTGDILVTAANIYSYALDGTYTNTYVASSATHTIVKVLDSLVLDAYGNYTELTLRANAAEVDANPGSYWRDTGANKLYIRTADSRAPSTTVWPMLQIPTGSFTGNRTVYLENITFVGSYSNGASMASTGTGQTPRFYAKNCKFLNSSNNGFQDVGCVESILQNCEAAKNTADGFNYTPNHGNLNKAIEIDCNGHDNGIDSNDQGSTVHAGSYVCRINGNYQRNTGDNIADVGAGTVSWNLACVLAYPSEANVRAEIGSAIYLDSCELSGATPDLNIADADSAIRLKLTPYASATNSGVLEAY